MRRVTVRGRPARPAARTSPGDPADLAKDGVRITGMSGGGEAREAGTSVVSAEFEVTNPEVEPFTCTVDFALLAESGVVLGNAQQTVRSVRPSRTVRRTVRIDTGPPDASDRVRVRIEQVRRVPSAEVPAEAGTCPPSGVRITADDGEAAMGLRVVGLRLENCGTRPYRLDGSPELALLDEERDPAPGGGIATVTGIDAPPRPVSL
ncbi:DUF4232 domain-containing protein [Streptomyces sclerotialus]|uniref:DUF4232 domain-containing protein n=1 Tax=Streptomyces sclerotialus TaxID=1957 RepID=UPI000B2CADDB